MTKLQSLEYVPKNNFFERYTSDSEIRKFEIGGVNGLFYC